MKKLIAISFLAIMLGLTGCSSEETSSKEKGSASEAKNETKVQSRDDVKLMEDEILVVDEETGDSEKVKAIETESKKGLSFKLPVGYEFDSLEESSESVSTKINAPYDSYISIAPSVGDRDVVNLPSFESFLGSNYGTMSKDGKYTQIDITTLKDSFIRNNVVYLVEFTPRSQSKKKAYGGLVAVGDKMYDFEIYLGNNDYSDTVFDTTIGMLATLK